MVSTGLILNHKAKLEKSITYGEFGIKAKAQFQALQPRDTASRSSNQEFRAEARATCESWGAQTQDSRLARRPGRSRPGGSC